MYEGSFAQIDAERGTGDFEPTDLPDDAYDEAPDWEFEAWCDVVDAYVANELPASAFRRFHIEAA